MAGFLLSIPLGTYIQGRRNVVPWYSRSRGAAAARLRGDGRRRVLRPAQRGRHPRAHPVGVHDDPLDDRDGRLLRGDGRGRRAARSVRPALDALERHGPHDRHHGRDRRPDARARSRSRSTTRSPSWCSRSRASSGPTTRAASACPTIRRSSTSPGSRVGTRLRAFIALLEGHRSFLVVRACGTSCSRSGCGSRRRCSRSGTCAKPAHRTRGSASSGWRRRWCCCSATTSGAASRGGGASGRCSSRRRSGAAMYPILLALTTNLVAIVAITVVRRGRLRRHRPRPVRPADAHDPAALLGDARRRSRPASRTSPRSSGRCWAASSPTGSGIAVGLVVAGVVTLVGAADVRPRCGRRRSVPVPPPSSPASTRRPPPNPKPKEADVADPNPTLLPDAPLEVLEARTIFRSRPCAGAAPRAAAAGQSAASCWRS